MVSKRRTRKNHEKAENADKTTKPDFSALSAFSVYVFKIISGGAAWNIKL
jgi:hypothetical protein